MLCSVRVDFSTSLAFLVVACAVITLCAGTSGTTARDNSRKELWMRQWRLEFSWGAKLWGRLRARVFEFEQVQQRPFSTTEATRCSVPTYASHSHCLPFLCRSLSPEQEKAWTAWSDSRKAHVESLARHESHAITMVATARHIKRKYMTTAPSAAGDPLYPPLTSPAPASTQSFGALSLGPLVFRPARRRVLSDDDHPHYPSSISSAVLAWTALSMHVCARPLQPTERSYRYGTGGSLDGVTFGVRY